MERGAGAEAHLTDADYQEVGAAVGSAADAWAADAVLKVAPPEPSESSRAGSLLIGFLNPLANPERVRRLAAERVTAFAMEAIPRISRAQSMDALSSQSNVAGYKAALLGAEHSTRFYPMLTTAAGTIPPARILVLGAGVAGLQAIATARRLGAVVSAFDVRPAVKEQVESLGANFLELDVEGAEGQGGYAVALSDDQHEREQELIGRHVAESDAVITTALIPGRPAPVLITADAARGMRPGSVIVDLAAEAGGNCELTQPGETVNHGGVRVLGPLNVPASVPLHASQMLSRNFQNFLLHLLKKGELQLDLADEITSGALITKDGAIANAAVKNALGTQNVPRCAISSRQSSSSWSPWSTTSRPAATAVLITFFQEQCARTFAPRECAVSITASSSAFERLMPPPYSGTACPPDRKTLIMRAPRLISLRTSARNSSAPEAKTCAPLLPSSHHHFSVSV